MLPHSCTELRDKLQVLPHSGICHLCCWPCSM